MAKANKKDSPKKGSKNSPKKEKGSKKDSPKDKKGSPKKGSTKTAEEQEAIVGRVMARRRYHRNMDSIFKRTSENLILLANRLHVYEIWNKLPVVPQMCNSNVEEEVEERKLVEAPIIEGIVCMDPLKLKDTERLFVEVRAEFRYHSHAIVPPIPPRLDFRHYCYRDYVQIYPVSFEREILANEFNQKLIKKCREEYEEKMDGYAFYFDLTCAPDSIFLNRPYGRLYEFLNDSGIIWQLRCFVSESEFCAPHSDNEIIMNFWKYTYAPVLPPECIYIPPADPIMGGSLKKDSPNKGSPKKESPKKGSPKKDSPKKGSKNNNAPSKKSKKDSPKKSSKNSPGKDKKSAGASGDAGRPTEAKSYLRYQTRNDVGDLLLSAQLERDVYYYGEPIAVSLAVENYSQRHVVTQVSVFLEQTVRIYRDTRCDYSLRLNEVILVPPEPGLPIPPKGKSFQKRLELFPKLDLKMFNVAMEGHMDKDKKYILASSTVILKSVPLSQQEIDELAALQENTKGKKGSPDKKGSPGKKGSPDKKGSKEKAEKKGSKGSPKDKKGSPDKGKKGSPDKGKKESPDKGKKQTPTLSQENKEEEENQEPPKPPEKNLFINKDAFRSIQVAYDIVVRLNLQTPTDPEAGNPQVKVPFALTRQTWMLDKLVLSYPPHIPSIPDWRPKEIVEPPKVE